MNPVATVAKKVLREAAALGVDAGGTAVCGPLWPFFKRVLSPVFEELEQRFPKLFLLPDKADRAAVADRAVAADMAAATLEKNAQLIEALGIRFDHEYEAEKEKQKEIMAFLVGLEETVTDIKVIVSDIGDKISDVDFKALAVQVGEMHEMMIHVSKEPSLSIEEIDQEVTALQADAMRWVQARVPHTAHRRLTQARSLIADGIERDPQNARLYSLRGYVEKTQGQVHTLQGRRQEFVSDIANASKYFGAALKINPYDVGALNGSANIAFFARDYDTAIRLGRIVVSRALTYGAGAWDLALALEEKIGRDGQTPGLVEELKGIYQRLLELMSVSRSGFSSAQLNYVQTRLEHWRRP